MGTIKISCSIGYTGKGYKAMTIKEFMEENQALDNQFTSSCGEKLSETMAKCTSVWSNDAAKGYIITMAQRMGMSQLTLDKLLEEINYAFSDLTVKEAEQKYYDY